MRPVLGKLLRLLAVRPLRRRPLRAFLAIAAVAAGTAMAVSVFVVRSSVSESMLDFGRELAGPTELRVVGAVRRGGLEPEVVDKVAAVPGVARAVPIVQGVTLVETPAPSPGEDPVEKPVVVFGIDCRAKAFAGDFGCTDDLVADHGDRPLAVGPGLPEGSRLLTPQGQLDLTGMPVFEGLDDVGGWRFVVFSLPSAQRVFARGERLDVIYVEAQEGTDVGGLQSELEAVVGDQNAVLTADEGQPEVQRALADVLPMFTLLAVFGLVTGGMLVYNTVTLSLEERRRELAIVGALGGTPSVVVSTTLAEAGALGAIGGVVGAGAGAFVARPIVGTLSSLTERLAGMPIELHVGARSLVVGALLGVVVGMGAAVLPVRRALRVDVAGELSGRGIRTESSAPHLLRQSILWACLTVVGLAMTWIGQRDGGLETWQVPAASLGFAAAAIGLLFCGARLSPLAIRPLQRLLPRTAVSQLAAANLSRAPGRTGVMVVAVSAALTTAFVTAGYIHSVTVDITQSAEEEDEGLSVSSVQVGANANLDAGIPEEVLVGLAEVPGVAAVHRGALVFAGARVDDVVRVFAYDDPWILDDDGEEQLRGRIDADAFRRGEVVVNATLARDEGLRPGDMLTLPTPTGMVDLTVQAVVASGGATGRGVQIDYDLHRDLYGLQPSKSVRVEPEPGVSLDELAHRLRDTDLGVDLLVQTPTEDAADVNDGVQGQMAPFWTLQRGLLAVSFVAVLSTLLLVGVQRQREMGMLAAVGMEPATLRRMVLAEAGVVGLLAIGFAAIAGVVMLWAILYVSPLLTGWVNDFNPDWVAFPLWSTVAVAVAVLAAAWPARRAARTDVVVALRYE